MEADPWSSSLSAPPLETIRSFEDNFKPVGGFPDSAQYIASLEKKLKLLGSNKIKKNNKELIDSLEEKRQDVVIRLLTENNFNGETFLDENIPTKWLKSYINPEQALTVGELLSLVKEDYLAKNSEESETEVPATMDNEVLAPRSGQLKKQIFSPCTPSKSMNKMATWGKKTLCLVTGASRGIGREIAVQFAQKMSPDSTLILSARSEKGLSETSTLITKVQPNITIKLFPYDMSKPKLDDFKNQLASYASTPWDLYLLVHNVGSEGSGRFIKDCDNPEDWQLYMSLNLYSMVSLTSAFLKTFEKDDKTIIVNITSLAAVQAIAGLGEYSVAKCAREMYMQALAAENPSLRLLSYSPGPVDTDMVDRLIGKLESSDSKEMFDKLKREETILKAEVTVNKLVKTIGDDLPHFLRIDYYDR